MTLKEIETKKAELRNKVDSANSQEELNEIRKQIEELEKEVPEKEEISKEEERGLLNDTENLEKRNNEGLKVKREERKMEKKYTIESPEYRSAWAKSLMGVELNEVEQRALGDAVGTTATTFVASTGETQGINNLGLLIPTSVRKEFLEIISEESPIFRDIRKMQVKGNIDVPFLEEADNAEWYAELVETKNEGQKYNKIQITGFELAKDVVITWKAEEMTVDGFIEFILDELKDKMGSALIEAVIYGNGDGKPTGITHGLTPVEAGSNEINTILSTYKALPRKARRGAKVYISTDVNLGIIGYQDLNGNYPYLSGVPTFKGFAVEVDPYLHDGDIVAGNCRNYILNEQTPFRVDREKTVKGRKVTYGGYLIADGKAKPEAFTYSQYASESGSGV